MAIAFGSAGASAHTTSTTLSLAYPASISSGDLLIACVANKYPTNGPSTPAGWTLPTGGQQSGGHGAAAPASGNTYSTVFYKVATGGEAGSLSITITGNNEAIGMMFRYTKGASASWVVSATNGSFNNGNDPNWTITTATNPGIVTGDMVIASSSASSARTWTAEACSCSGVTFGTMTEREDEFAADADWAALVVSEHPVTTGPSGGNLTYTKTASNSDTNGPAGASIILLLNEQSNATETLDVGTFTLTGEDVGQGTTENVDVGTFTLTGQDALSDGSELMDVGIFALSGQDVTSTTGTVGSTTTNPVTGDNLTSAQPMMKEVYRFGRLGGGLFN